MEEIWKVIDEYPDYMVSNMGRIKSLKLGKEKILTPRQRCGYPFVTLFKDCKRKQTNIHRLVAQAFIPNPDNKPCIDHINTDRTDNRVENLRWVTHKENSNNPLTIKKMHSANIGEKNNMYNKCGKHHFRSKPILQLTPYGEFLKKWECTTEPSKKLKYSQGNIWACCKGERKTAYGYVWGFADEYEKIPFKVFDLEIYEKKVA